MNRKFKFKAFHKKDKEFLHTEKLIDPNIVPVVPDGENFTLKDNAVIFLQYIGAKDADGYELYESDIVDLYHENPETEELSFQYRGVIRWEELMMMFVIVHPANNQKYPKGCIYQKISDLGRDSRLIKIGNTLSTPHLIEIKL